MATATRLETGLYVRSGVAVAPQLVAQSALLELSYAELESRIEQELLDNPALDLLESPAGRRLPLLPAGAESAESADLPSWEDRLRAPYTLRDDLWWQFRAGVPRALHEIGSRLIASVDEAGYLRADLFEVAAELGAPLAEVEEAVSRLQQLEPAGVGARSLSECLLLQVARLRGSGEPVPAATERVIRACGGSAGADLVGQLARRTGCRRAIVEQALQFLRDRLYPYPGYRFFSPDQAPSDTTIRQYPDVLIHRGGEEFTVEVPLSRARFLRLSAAYLDLERAQQALAASEGAPGEAAALEQLQRAREFLHLLERREQVLRLITLAVLRAQREYLLRGPLAHQPLSKKDIARATGLHESTVCRATRGKFVLLPQGEVVSFDVFFEPGVPEKSLIARLIRRETARRPLSDREIARLLAEQGYLLARRTVAKYRQALGIPSSARRRARG